MKTFLVYFISAFFAITAQSTLFSFNGITPDLVLVLICFYSLKFGQIKGMTYGALTGLLIDSINGFLIGPHVMSKALVGFMAVTIREKFFNWNLFLNTALILLLSIFDNFVVYISLETFTTMSFAGRPLEPSILQIVFTTAVGLILYIIMNYKKPQQILIN